MLRPPSHPAHEPLASAHDGFSHLCCILTAYLRSDRGIVVYMAASALCFPRSERFGGVLCPVDAGSENGRKRMRRKTVTWPVDEEICEVRYFDIDDVPSSLSAAFYEKLHFMEGVNHIAQQLSESDVVGAKRARVEEDDIPPGFGFSSVAIKPPHRNSHSNATMTAIIEWQQPCMFVLNESWLWAGGEESTEIVLQQERERRVFEAFYPRPASIPESSLEPQGPSIVIIDSQTSHVSLIPIDEMIDKDSEQEKKFVDNRDKGLEFDALATANNNIDSMLMVQSKANARGTTDSNFAAAATAARMALKAIGDSDLVDESLLLEILKNPSLLQSLVSSNNLASFKGQDYKKNPANGRQPACKEHQWCMFDHEAYLNGSPVSVLKHCMNGVCSSNTCKKNLAANKSTFRQHPVNMKASNGNMANSIHLPTTYPCSYYKSSMNVGQNGVECLMVYPQRTENSISNLSTNVNPNIISSTRGHKPLNGLSSKNESKASLNANCMQPPMFTRLPFRDLPNHMPKKDLVNNKVMLMPSESLKHATIGLPRTAIISSCAQAGRKFGRLCLFYNSPQGCRNGNSCAFVHQSRDFGANRTAPLSTL